MPLEVAVGTLAAGAGARSVTGLSFAPKAVILGVTNRTSAGISTSIGQFGMGFLASGSARALAHTSRNGGTSTGNIDEEVRMTSGAIVMLNTFGSIHLEASLTSLNSDGFTINCSTASSAWLITYIALGGADLTDVAVGDFLTGTSTGDVDVTGLGFEPDAVLMAHVNVGTALPFTSRTGTRFGFGVGVSATERWAMVRNVRDQVLPTEAAAEQRADAVLLGLTTGNAQDMVGDYAGPITGGFRVNLSDAPASTVRVAYMALKGPGFKAGLETMATSATAKDTATTGITPKALILGGNLKTAGAGIDTATDAMTMLGFSDLTNEACVTCRTADAANPADVLSELTAVRPLMLSTISGTTTHEADASAAADKFTLTYATAGATAHQFGYLAIADTPAGGAVKEAAATISATSTVTAAPTRRRAAGAGIAGQAAVSITARRRRAVALTIGGQSAVTVAARKAGLYASPTIAGQSAITAAARRRRAASPAVGALSSLSIRATRRRSVSVAIAASSTISISPSNPNPYVPPTVAIGRYP